MGEVVAKHITHKDLGAKTNKRICKERLKQNDKEANSPTKKKKSQNT